MPVSSDNIGLDYAATQERPVRGVTVELVNASGQVLANTRSDGNGQYLFSQVPANTQVRVRVKAELIQTGSPGWNIAVTDNTNGNALYTAQGGLADSGTSDSVRNLHASSGWGGSSYTETRVAAPYAILDSIYTGLLRLQAAGLTQTLPALEFRWSKDNVPVGGEPEAGEIGTSYYVNNTIYLLGAADNDTDEYDEHVVLHEWVHYLEDAISRSDSIGGSHSGGDRLDMRVAFSEGLGNALAGIFLDDPLYRDSGGAQQSEGFFYDISAPHPTNKGWYSEASAEVFVYNFYLDAGQALDEILQSFTASSYRNNPALISIYPFVAQLKSDHPGRTSLINSILSGENIATSANAYGSGETNEGGDSRNLPVYKLLPTDGAAVNLCSSPANGKYNKLGVTQFLRFTLASTGNYRLLVERSGGASVPTDPDFAVFRNGSWLFTAETLTLNQEQAERNFSSGNYVLEVYDWNNRDPDNEDQNTTCFDVRLTPA